MYSEEKINQYINKIVGFYKPEKIILFGSYGYGKPTNESDVDLLIIKETAQPVIKQIVS